MNDQLPEDDRRRHDAERLLDALFLGPLSEEDQQRLNDLLRRDDAFRQQYLLTVALQADLEWTLIQAAPATSGSLRGDPATSPSDPETVATSAPAPRVRGTVRRGPTLGAFAGMAVTAARRFVRREPVLSTIAATIVLAVVIGTLALTRVPSVDGDRAPAGSRHAKRQFAARVGGTYQADWGFAKSKVERPASSGGTLSRAFPGIANVRDPKSLQTNADLFVGDRIFLKSGLAEIYFAKGAKVVLEGPAELTIDGGNYCSLDVGKLVARVEIEGAKGFAVETPSATITDLGTEFAVEYIDGASLVAVIRGMVETVPTRREADGRTIELAQATRVEAGESVRVGSDGKVTKTDAPVAGAFQRRVPASVSELPITEEYVAMVRAAKPALYWRFEAFDDHGTQGEVVENDIAASHPLRRVGDVRIERVDRDNSAAVFTGSGERALVCDEAIEAFRKSNYTVELWFQPAAIGHGYIMYASDDASDVHGKCLFLLAQQNSAGGNGPLNSIRFLHRWPSGRRGGANAISKSPLAIGRWHHMASVFADGTISLYLEGRLAATTDEVRPLGAAAMALILGQAAESGGRPFTGKIDEVAIYNRALSEAEIRQRVQLVKAERKAPVAEGDSQK